MSRILGLDVSSSSTGWALTINNRFYLKEECYYGIISPEKNLTLAEKLEFFRVKLIEILDKTKPDIVIIEDVFLQRNVSTLKLLSRFSGVAIEAVKSNSKIEPQLQTVKKIRSKVGTQDKKSTYTFVVERFKLPWKKEDFNKRNDITDALALCLFVTTK